jgi:outer membrane protein insertion porin family/translocation and assembly module TamA
MGGRGLTGRAAPSAAAALALCAALLGCYSIPAGRAAVDRVEILGSSEVPAGEVEDRIATAESPRFLGLWDGVVFDYAYYDKFVVARDIARIERFYKARGFYEARVRAARVVTSADGHVRVQFAVDEGPPMLIDYVRLNGIELVPFADQAGVVEAVRAVRAGDRFDEDRYVDAKNGMLTALTDRGYAWAALHGHVVANLITHRASIVYDITPGPRFKIRNVLLQGLGPIPEGPIRRALDLEPGEEFSTRDLRAAEQALLDLGVLTDVDVTWQKPRKPGEPVPLDARREPAVDVVVRVSPALLRTLKLGGGGELDVIRTDVHASIGWEDRNFLGGLRRFSIGVRPGLVLFPTVLPTLKAPSRLLPESRASAELRQPGLLEARTHALVRGEFNVYPVLFRPLNEDVILGYRELKNSWGVERMLLGGRLHAATLFHLQANYPFTYHGKLDEQLSRVLLRYVEIQTDVSWRDSAVRPHKGVFLGNNLQLAGGPLDGDITDVKVQPDVRFYVPISRTVTFAVRGSVGFLFPRNYGDTLAQASPDTQKLDRDVQLLFFRAFFSGGPTSNRGYPYRGIGPHGAAPFLSPHITTDQLLREECNLYSPAYNPNVCAVPLGGLSLWEASAELRFPILGPLTGALFTDTSDVARQRTTLRFDYPHLSTGAGLRYDTPIGPVRLDVGYRVPGLQRIGGELDPKREGDPGTVFGAPIAFAIAVGETF